MKQTVVLSLLCVIFISLFNVKPAYCMQEQINFVFKDRIFTYNLATNIKTSNLFDENYEINKYNRFSTKQQRKELLVKMLNAGLDEKVAINYLFPNLSKTVERIKKNVEIKAKDATLSINSNASRVFNIMPEVVGRRVNEAEIYKQICHNCINEKPLTINIKTISINPETISEHYQKFTNLRADFSTDISNSSADRKHNIKNALQSLNKVEIMPNQVFSFNKVVGKRTEQNGYRQAKIIVNNEYVDGVGGGVCQVSTTLYNAALMAGLSIVEANKHSRQVGYVKYGFDAMVNFGSSDLKFKNNTAEKITLITNYNGKTARVRIFGEGLNGTTYRLKNEILSTTEPTEEIKFDLLGEHLNQVEFEDEYFYLKKPYRGMEVRSVRETYVNGKLTNVEQLRVDKYKVQNAIKVFGIKKRTENCALNVA